MLILISKIVQSAKEISAVQPVTPASGPGLFERFSKKVSESLPTLVNIGVGAVGAFEETLEVMLSTWRSSIYDLR